MKLPTIEDIGENQKVVLRLDLDVPIDNGIIGDNSRLIKSIPTIRMLLSRGCKLIIVGHLGRPSFEGNKVNDISRQELTLKPVYVELMSLLENGEDSISNVFVEDIKNKQAIFEAVESNQIVFLENIRFLKEETEGKVEFLGHLAEIGNVFVNDALAVAHRKNASVLLYKMMPVFYGLGFSREIEKMAEFLINPKRPVILVLGGAKKDKLDNLEILSKKIDLILIGGKLPLFMSEYPKYDNVIWAKLDGSQMDISKDSIERFIKEIKKAETVILAGSMGMFEQEEHRLGSKIVAETISLCQATKIAAGGDTRASLELMGLVERFDYICSGGGVALEFLVNEGKLPAWDNSFVNF